MSKFEPVRKNQIGIRPLIKPVNVPIPLSLAADAIGSKKSNNVQGELFFNAQDFGAKGDGSQDDGPAIQACLDALAEAQGDSPLIGTAFLPQPKWGYLVKNPIFMDHPNQTIMGGGNGSRVQCIGGNPALYLGIKRDKPTDPKRFPDAFGVLDKSAVVEKGKRIGQTIGGESTIEFQANGFQYGMMAAAGHYDYWAMSKFTLEFCIDFGGEPALSTTIFGMGDWQNPSPFLLSTSGNVRTDWFLICRVDSSPNNLNVGFSTAGFKGPLRIAIEGDLDAGKFVVFINDKSVATTYSERIKPGSKLVANDFSLFKIGGSKQDFNLYGLRFSNICRYDDAGIGNPLPNPPKDGDRYFKGDANTIAYLTMNSNDYLSQLVGFWNQGGNTGKAIRLSKTNIPWNKNIAVKNLEVQGDWSCGTGITVGNIFGVDIDHVNVSGLIGIASHPIACTYPFTLTNCTIGGRDCALFGYFIILKAINTDISMAGRDAIRCVSCNTDWDTVFVASPSTDTVFKYLSGGYGANTRMKNVLIDFEGYVLNTAVVYAENCCYVPNTTLSLTDFWIGTVGEKAACIILRDIQDSKDGAFKKAWLTVENVSTWGPYRTFVETDGPLWGGVINAYFLSETNLSNHIPTHGPRSNVTFTNVGLAVK